MITYKSLNIELTQLNHHDHANENLLTNVHTLKWWKYCLLGTKIKIVDRPPVFGVFVHSTKLKWKMMNYMDGLPQEFDFDIEYIEGNKNVVADAPCRRSMINAFLMQSHFSNLLWKMRLKLIMRIMMHLNDCWKFILRI